MSDTTLYVHLVFSALAILICLTRLIAKRYIFRILQIADWIVVAAILCAATRTALIYVVLTWGTNNLSSAARASIDFTPQEIYRREIGSKFTIANRPIYNTYLWLLKLVLLDFFCRHFHTSPNARRMIWWIYGSVFFATWAAAFIVGFTECDPIAKYWTVIPAPGKCVQAQVQLIVLGVLNILTDLMLLLLPLPTLFSLQTPWKRKLRLMVICTLGIFIIAITVIRLPINALNASVQANRTVWASTELLTAAIVANAPTLYGAFNKARHRGQDRTFDASDREVRGSATAGASNGGHSHQMAVRGNQYDDEDLMLKSEHRGDGPSDFDYPGVTRGAGQGIDSSDFAHRAPG